MSYVEGFVAAVPAANKEIYRKHAAEAAPIFKEFGVLRHVETWGDEVPDGKLTDFRRAVKAEPDEVIVFSWFEYPDRATRDAANEKIMADPRMEQMGQEMPFDGRRMIYGGFASLADTGGSERGGYVDGSLLAVPVDKKEAFGTWAAKVAVVFREYGAVRVIDAWGDSVPDGKVTDFKRAVKAGDGEEVVFGWVEWPSKAVRDAAWPQVMADARAHPEEELFDGRRMVYGGFVPILDV